MTASDVYVDSCWSRAEFYRVPPAHKDGRWFCFGLASRKRTAPLRVVIRYWKDGSWLKADLECGHEVTHTSFSYAGIPSMRDKPPPTRKRCTDCLL